MGKKNQDQREIFSKNLRDILHKKGWSQKTLADMIRYRYGITIDRSHVNHWYHGRSMPTAININYIAEVLEIDQRVLLGTEPTPQEHEHCEIVERCYGSGAKEAVRKLLLLNADGQQRVHEYIDLLLQSGQYDKRYEKRETS